MKKYLTIFATIGLLLSCGEAAKIDIPATSISLDQNSVTLFSGESFTLSATILPENTTSLIEWQSSDESVVTVTEGVVSAIAEGKATISAQAGSVKAECEFIVKKAVLAEAVDLGLSVKWASFNVGADSPEKFGDYFAWGETEPKEWYGWDNYKWYNKEQNGFTKYCPYLEYWAGTGSPDGKSSFSQYNYEDDAATFNWGKGWRTPSEKEWEELRTQCSWKWTTQNGVPGQKVTSKKTGYKDKSIFLPAAGCWEEKKNYYVEEYGMYWSSVVSLKTNDSYFDYPGSSWSFVFNARDVYSGPDAARRSGCSIRPVYVGSE